MADSDDGFVARWSHRKLTKRAPQTREPQEAEGAPAPAGKEPPPAEAGTAEEAEIVEQLPDIDSLDDSSDFTVFLQEGVPEALRRKALRRLWRVNPVLANLDGLNDYDEDFTTAAAVVKGVRTLYKVGKGYVEEKTAEDEAEEQTAEGESEARQLADDGAPAASSATSSATSSGAPAEAGAQPTESRQAGPADPGANEPRSGAPSGQPVGAEMAGRAEDEKGAARIARAKTSSTRSARRRRWGDASG